MTPEEKELLKRIEKQVEENNDILRGMRSAERRNKLLKLIYWIVVILIGLYVWKLMQPIIESLMNAFAEIVKAKDSLGGSISGVGDSLGEISNSLNKLKELGL